METKSCIFLGKTGKKGIERKRTPWNILGTFWLVQTHKWLLSIWNELATIKPKQKETPKYFYIMFQYILLCLRSQQIYSTLPSACGLRKYVIANQLFQCDLQFCNASGDHFGLVLTSCLSQFRLERSDPTRHLHTQIKGSYLNWFAKKCESNHYAIS